MLLGCFSRSTTRRATSLIGPVALAAWLGAACGGGDTTPFGPTGASSGAGAGAASSSSGSGPSGGSLEVVRDARGVPHIFAETLADAMYGLGYSTAEDRLYQMDFSRRWMRGRLAEVFGRGPGDATLKSDIRMRTLGFAPHADAVAAKLPEDVRLALEAYAAGVNAWVAHDGFALPPAFAEAGVAAFEAWTVGDSLLVWERLREIFGSDDSASEINRLAECQGGCPVPTCNPGVDEEAAVVPNPAQASLQAPAEIERRPLVFKASHAWVVAGSRTTTGEAVLHSDPQTPVTAPSIWYEAHLVATAEGIDSRGIGVAGTPGFLIGYGRHFATGATAAGGDLSDLYQLELAAGGDAYLLDGEEIPFETRTETIAIEGGASEEIEVRTSAWGPVVTPLLREPPPNMAPPPAGAEFALHHTDLVADDTHSVVALVRMLSATDLDSYRATLADYRSPGIHALYADEEGHIAYHTQVALHRRKTEAEGGTNPEPGRHPWDGSTTSQDWGAPLDVDERPHRVDPPEGYLFSANHLAVGDWFPHYTGLTGVGDSVRSYRLRAIFADKLGDPAAKVTPEDVLAIHSDSAVETVRVVHEALQHLEDAGQLEGRAAAKSTLAALDLWQGEISGADPVTPLADWLAGNMKFRPDTTPALVCQYNGGEGGLCRWMKAIDADKSLLSPGSPDVAFLLDVAEKAWAAVGADKGEPSTWKAAPVRFTVRYQSNFFCATGPGSCSLDPSKEFEVELDNATTNTILSQAGNSYSQWVSFADVDGAQAVLPPGVSEDPASALYKTGMSSWLAGQLEPAPLERTLVEAGAISTTKLTIAE